MFEPERPDYSGTYRHTSPLIDRVEAVRKADSHDYSCVWYGVSGTVEHAFRSAGTIHMYLSTGTWRRDEHSAALVVEEGL